MRSHTGLVRLMSLHMLMLGVLRFVVDTSYPVALPAVMQDPGR